MDASLKDGLSAPLTVVSLFVTYTIDRLSSSVLISAVDASAAADEALNNGDPLHVVVVGATAVNEEVHVTD